MIAKLIFFFLLLVSRLKTVVLLDIFYGNCEGFFQYFLMTRKSKRTAFILNRNILYYYKCLPYIHVLKLQSLILHN